MNGKRTAAIAWNELQRRQLAKSRAENERLRKERDALLAQVPLPPDAARRDADDHAPTGAAVGFAIAMAAGVAMGAAAVLLLT